MKKKYELITKVLLSLIGVTIVLIIILSINTDFSEQIVDMPVVSEIDERVVEPEFIMKEVSENEAEVLPIKKEPETETETEMELNETPPIDWNGKRAIILGDSIVDYDGDPNIYDVNEIMVGYTHYLYELGFEHIENQGHSGAGIAYHDSGIKDVCTVADEVNFSKYDLVIISAGVNDFLWLYSPMGDINDESDDTEFFYGAYQYILHKIMADNPDAVIVLTTPLRCDGYSGYHEYNPYQLNLEDYANAIKEIGKKYNLPVVDFFSFDKFNQNMRGYTLDGLHPNNEGYEIISNECLVPFIKSLKSE